jgi:hypothetical protein
MNLRFGESAPRKYLRRLSSVQGWLQRFSAEAIAAVSLQQVSRGIHGAVAEIGVHHGKLFFILYLTTTPDENALAIDVFRAQHLNLDKSGRGDKDVFLAHARRLGGTHGLVLIEDSSLNLTPEQVLDACGPVRLFSIDGAHTEAATRNDIRLAERSIIPEGIVVIDDYFNEYFPEVSVAVSRYMDGGGDLRPFAITPGKILLCREPMARTYTDALTAAFPHRVDKTVLFFGHYVTLFGILPLTLRRRIAKTTIWRSIKKFVHA